jgi:hypothetical protein
MFLTPLSLTHIKSLFKKRKQRAKLNYRSGGAPLLVGVFVWGTSRHGLEQLNRQWVSRVIPHSYSPKRKSQKEKNTKKRKITERTQ